MAATDIARQVIWSNTGPTLLARIVGSTGGVMKQADIASIKFNRYNLSSSAPSVILTTGILSTTDNIFDTPQTDSRWTSDTVGYTFLALLSSTGFQGINQRYQVPVWITPSSTSDQPFPVVFGLPTKAVFGS